MQREVRDLQQDKQAMQDELRDLQDRLTQFALQVPDDSIGDVLADNLTGTAAGSRSRSKPLNTHQEAVIAEVSPPGFDLAVLLTYCCCVPLALSWVCGYNTAPDSQEHGQVCAMFVAH